MKGDICLLHYQSRMSSGHYRLCKITDVFPDAQGVVRTVEVGYRPRDKREAVLPFVPKDLTRIRVPVQRLVVLLPHDEAVSQELTQDTMESES